MVKKVEKYLAVLTQYRRVTYGQTDGRTTLTVSSLITSLGRPFQRWVNLTLKVFTVHISYLLSHLYRLQKVDKQLGNNNLDDKLIEISFVLSKSLIEVLHLDQGVAQTSRFHAHSTDLHFQLRLRYLTPRQRRVYTRARTHVLPVSRSSCRYLLYTACRVLHSSRISTTIPIRCSKSAQKSADHVCQVATVVMETTQLVPTQFKRCYSRPHSWFQPNLNAVTVVNWELNNVSLYRKELVNVVNRWSYVILITRVWFL